MTEKFEPGDQVRPACRCHSGAVGTVGHSDHDDTVSVWLPFADDESRMVALDFSPDRLTLIARYADLAAEDEAQGSDPFNWLTTDTLDATQEAIDRVRASERRGSVEPEPPVHAQILAEAEALLVGDRQADYGPPEVNFRRIADVWDVLIPKPGGWAPADVALAMAGLKLARAAQGFKRDSAVDAAAYVALWAHLQRRVS